MIAVKYLTNVSAALRDCYASGSSPTLSYRRRPQEGSPKRDAFRRQWTLQEEIQKDPSLQAVSGRGRFSKGGRPLRDKHGDTQYGNSGSNGTQIIPELREVLPSVSVGRKMWAKAD